MLKELGPKTTIPLDQNCLLALIEMIKSHTTLDFSGCWQKLTLLLKTFKKRKTHPTHSRPPREACHSSPTTQTLQGSYENAKIVKRTLSKQITMRVITRSSFSIFTTKYLTISNTFITIFNPSFCLLFKNPILP